MQYKTQETKLKELDVLKAFLSPVNFKEELNLSADEMELLMNEQHIKNQAFETTELKNIAEELASVIHCVQNPCEEIDYNLLHKKMQSVTQLLQKVEVQNIEELKYINSLLEQIEQQNN